MQPAQLEPGILATFRLFLIAQLVLILANLHVHSARGLLPAHPATAVTLAVAGILLLLGYLSWPRLEHALRRFYLPIALVCSVVFSLVAQNLFLITPLSVAARSSEEHAWQLFLFLFIPLVLVGQQYGFKSVIAYCLFTAVFDYVLVSRTDTNFSLIEGTYHRLLFIRFLSFLLAGYIISRIMRQLRSERQALQEANRKLAGFVATIEQLTVSRERNRMARELHDILAHTLSGVSVQLEAARTLLGERQQAGLRNGPALAQGDP